MKRSRKPIDALLWPGTGGKSRQSGWRVPAADNPALQVLWQVVGEIPRGRVSTYGAVARAAGLPGRARLAGAAMRLAPPGVPWHRVVGAGGHIVFPRSSAGFREQARLLRAEGVQVREGRVVPCALTDLDLDER